MKTKIDSCFTWQEVASIAYFVFFSWNLGLLIYGALLLTMKHDNWKFKEIVPKTIRKDGKFRNWLRGPSDPNAPELGRALHANLHQYA